MCKSTRIYLYNNYLSLFYLNQVKINQNLTTAILLIATPLPAVYSQQDDNASNVQELAFEATAPAESC